MLLAPIHISLISTSSNERRLNVEDAKMMCRISKSVWQSHRATKMQKVFYLFLSCLCLCLSICLPDLSRLSSDYVLFSPGRWHRFTFPYLINFSHIIVPICCFCLSVSRWSFIALASYFSEQFQLAFKLPFLSLPFCIFTFSD